MASRNKKKALVSLQKIEIEVFWHILFTWLRTISIYTYNIETCILLKTVSFLLEIFILFDFFCPFYWSKNNFPSFFIEVPIQMLCRNKAVQKCTVYNRKIKIILFLVLNYYHCWFLDLSYFTNRYKAEILFCITFLFFFFLSIKKYFENKMERN